MPDIASLIQSGGANAWLLLPTALLLGALHALEPGHSKSMMIAFIVAVQGTARQAALLALSATVGHTLIVWVLALLAWRLGDAKVLERAEPWLLILGGVLLIALSFRILQRLAPPSTHRGHQHGHHHHHDGQGHDHSHDGDHAHGARAHGPFESEDAHAAFHDADIKAKFAGKTGAVTNGEIAWFGFTGGLVPCPAAFAVLLACLHQKAYGLGVVMVAAFSIGLAATMVGVGVAAAWGLSALKDKTGRFERIARFAPYVSAAMVLAIGLFAVAQGLRAFGLS